MAWWLFLSPLVGLRLRWRVFRFLVIADDTFHWADRECRTFLAADCQGNGTESHLTSPFFGVCTAGSLQVKARPPAWTCQVVGVTGERASGRRRSGQGQSSLI